MNRNKLIEEVESCKRDLRELEGTLKLMDAMDETNEKHVIVETYLLGGAETHGVRYIEIERNTYIVLYNPEMVQEPVPELYKTASVFSVPSSEEIGEYDNFTLLRAINGKLVDGEIVNDNQPLTVKG